MKRQHVSINESAPRYLIVAVHAPALSALVVSAHALDSADKDGPVWWSYLSGRIWYYLKDRPLIASIDAIIDIMRSCEPHIGFIVSNNKAEPKYQLHFEFVLRIRSVCPINFPIVFIR